MEDNKSTLIVFSGDLDKAIASFIIATGSAAMGNQVTMFFTFWGLNILRKEQYVPVQKSFMDKLFAKMLPRGPEKLGISKMNFGGLGAKLMKYTMKKKNITTLKELIEMAKELDIKMVACTMSMDVLGIKKEELIDGLEYAGVASYLAEANEAKINLFI
ncbi:MULTISPECIES: DsrE/DsrF/DrsH-like family protein [unclassified Thermoactinomyces]|uniref:DsrE/DsrF/DrsH-like family protein n=1 Tax=unclassified Thermoactinomyces TaxID=2634588 RepID=UPI0018DC6683|nr:MULTISPECIES: DsrE/DsrF/DrsH-like family protein [unclassified Thermoactinomyces]MBH8598626.1 DsrE/DsrF/DrsH-like family protein [Thermoactinomyces sp. CICC 10523]MBH8605118.1 DsrE/DsrF/DrsH-like family protein [Thermoactinomyces sp. CICC 10522]MBH8609066.1 DsrE/DsrF/DrsH-like family protein [Thermoactinomyces sp. CICC 10521]